ncbi:T9SS type A sorting domain-containing protein [Melioribacter sp. OK-6-Me]|uniref:T9SS type A sorting domain-containing protein n=1 Tax=unclassified Melioribacter TaxID=2627329 RepID=UPI003ED9EA1A
MKRIIILLVLPLMLLAQTREKYPHAAEIWSKPEEIKAISNWAGSVDGISVSADGKTLYISVAGIAVTELSDTGWTTPYKLGSHINIDYFVQTPAITPSSKRLFYTWLMGSLWHMYYSDWDSVKNDWGEPINCGPEVNIPYYGISGATAPDDTTIIFNRPDPVYIAYYNKETKQYNNVKGFPGEEGLNFVSAYGITTTQDLSKVYYLTTQPDTTLDGRYYVKEDLVVCYKKTNSTDYTRPYVLNISYQADTLYFNREYSKRGQAYPTITADGKTLFFVATYHGQQTVYVSHMLIDENGIPVSVNNESSTLPSNFQLYPPYPNPFNPTTTIEYELNRESKISITIYDTLGRKVKELFNGIKQAGKHKTTFNASGLSSGIYLVVLNTSSGFSVKKLTYLK